MKKIKKYIIPVMILLFFIGIMKSGTVLKKPFSKKDDVISYIEVLKKDVGNENWEQAKMDIIKVKSSWETVEKRIQFSVERNGMKAIDINIARIDGAIWAKDKASALIELSELIKQWNDLEK